MIIREVIQILDNTIYRNYSDRGMQIRNKTTGQIFTDVNSSIDYEYEEIEGTKEWHHDYEIRIIAPTALMDVETSILIHFVKNNLPVVVEGDTTYLYCNEILPEHQPMLDAFQQQGVVVEHKDQLTTQ